jgi:glycosyltransferase involved in cell wall biosynthesis
MPDVIFSFIIPAYNESERLATSLPKVLDYIHQQQLQAEVIVVNDGSRDGSDRVLRDLRRQYPFLEVITHRRQRGIADSLRSAGDVARGDVFVFYPADLQYLPEDIPALVAPILEGRADIVTGTKQGKYEKAFVSSVYNGLSRWLFGVRVTDLNSVKAYRREVMHGVPLRPDWHRYMVVIAAADGYRLTSLPVPLYPRRAGTSKFNWKRIPIGLFDLISVWFQLRFGRKPMLFFGVGGAILFVIGFLAGIAALVLRFGYGIGLRPLLNLVEMMVISGIVLFGFGFLGEIIAGMREETREIARDLARLEKPDVRD